MTDHINDTIQKRKRRRHGTIEAEYEERSKSIHAFCEEIRKYREETRRIHEETKRYYEETMWIHEETMRVQEENHRELVETIKSMMNQKQSSPTTQILPIKNSTQNSPIEVGTQSPQAIDDDTPPAIDHNTQSPQAIDCDTQSSPTIENPQFSPAIDNTQISPTIDHCAQSRPAIENMQISTIIDDTRISPAIKNTQISPTIDHDVQSRPAIENPQISPAIDNMRISTIIDNTQISPTIDNTQNVHSRVIHLPLSNGKVRPSRDPPNYPDGRPCILGVGIETVPLLIEEFNHIESCKWVKCPRERQYISLHRCTVEYVRISSLTTPIVKGFSQVDLLELYRVIKGLRISQLSVKINTFNESTESVGGRVTKRFTSRSKEMVDELLREFVSKSPEVFATYRLLDSSYL
ncbi:predicted protein [Meyerozyma guilliermondii ATCC 6260]|uniref:Uncharacterized protein n=1 Tax=Meyerozyma guilliermondii (strain ATCC 6260 / CBS 566 / DSM 6381 / JCM 1539 / NBRC 10279 / NRRL Y-324) TaxID=294746 RepID=A5DAG1_PICGU|nr:uncharacterized protein PGUG_00266 [Meyerozyma guilliermondii ATCC 6260]EDK36169.2 predicted protein [Meyerozyma guilliermondii ATCC 6260]